MVHGKRRLIPIFLAACAVLLAACIGIQCWYQANYLSIDGLRCRRDTQTLDLSGGPVEQWQRLTEFTALEDLDLRGTGLTPAQYDILQEALPECSIHWDVLFQDHYYPNDTQTITLSHISQEELELLDYFPQLATVNAVQCPQLHRLLTLQQRRPDCQVLYDVALAGEFWDNDSAELVLSGADMTQVAARLVYLPQVERIILAEPLPPAEDIFAFQTAHPEISLSWFVDICGHLTSWDTVELDLSGIVMEDLSAVERALPYLPGLEKVIMCDCGIPNEDMDAINRRTEGVRFVWNVAIGPYITLRTDVTTFMPTKLGIWVSDYECYNLRYCTDMICLDLGHHGLTRCDFVAFMPNLKYLILADTRISDISPLEGLKELVFLELFTTRVRDYSPLLSCTSLEDLNICYTYGQPEIIAQMTWLKRLWWIPHEDWRYYLYTRLPNTKIEVRPGSSTGAGWRTGQRYYEQRDLLEVKYMSG